MENQQQQYCPCSPPVEFWVALLHVRDYVYRDPAFSFFACMHLIHGDQLAADFWCVDNWLDKALLELNERKAAK